VPNNLSNTMTVINARTLRVVRTVPVGASPQHVTPSWDMRRLYVNNTAGNSLSVVNPKTGRITKTIGVTDPYNLYFTPDGKQAIVVAERYRRLDFRDPRRWTLEESVHVPSPGIDHLDFSADGRFLLASTEFSGWVYRVNVIKHRVTGKVHVGGLPVDVKAAPDGNVFYVANQGLNGVSLVDPHRMRRIGFIPTGDGAHGLCVSRDATRLYVSNRRGGSITVVSFAKRAKVATWHVGGSPDMLQVSADGTQLWVSNRFSGTVSVIDTRSGKVVKRIAVGQSPHGLAYFPQPGGYSVGHNGVYR
jgi:YVTN family beta-propeller protein